MHKSGLLISMALMLIGIGTGIPFFLFCASGFLFGMCFCQLYIDHLQDKRRKELDEEYEKLMVRLRRKFDQPIERSDER